MNNLQLFISPWLYVACGAKLSKLGLTNTMINDARKQRRSLIGIHH